LPDLLCPSRVWSFVATEIEASRHGLSGRIPGKLLSELLKILVSH